MVRYKLRRVEVIERERESDGKRSTVYASVPTPEIDNLSHYTNSNCRNHTVTSHTGIQSTGAK